MRKLLACAISLFLLNLYLVRELFFVEYTHYMESIEGAYIGIARQLAADWDLSWWPLWYGGIPYQNTYPPLLHWIDALIVKFAHVSAAHAYHFATAVFYAAGPVTLFWMLLRLSRLLWPTAAKVKLLSSLSQKVSYSCIPFRATEAAGAVLGDAAFGADRREHLCHGLPSPCGLQGAVEPCRLWI